MGARPARHGPDPAAAEAARVKSDRTGIVQYAALPWRYRPSGAVEVMLITSRETHRWVIPKGWPMSGFSPAEAAAIEAYEEAGLKGEMSRAVGSYDYPKRLKDMVRNLTVEVYPLKVEGQLTFWPEAQERRRRWFSLQNAAAAVEEPKLAEIIRAFQP